jgi:hypothetical protein
MTDIQSKSSEKPSIPSSYWIGQELDWQASPVHVELRVELPYWLMVPDCVLYVEVKGHKFMVEVKDGYFELYAGEVVDSKSTCLYIGPAKRLSRDLREFIEKSKAPVMRRKCKTVLRIHSDCNEDVIVASKEKSRRKRAAYYYLQSFCEAHLDIVNRLIQQYRLATYDYFAHEITPWDVPIWFVTFGARSVRIVLLDYMAWDDKPWIVTRPSGGAEERYKLIEPSELQAALTFQATAGEFDLMDALNLMERGDYSGAVRRITTAIEAQTEFVLRQELLKAHPSPDVEKKLKSLENKFQARLDLYQNLSNRKLSDRLAPELKATRELRHSIVHEGKRIPYNNRGQAQRSVDTGRWVFDWLENKPVRFDVREKKIGKRSLGRHFGMYYSEIVPAGVVVHKPHYDSLS